jgi:hypothetical protein
VAYLRLVSDGKVTGEARTFQTTTADLLRVSEWLAVNACMWPWRRLASIGKAPSSISPFRVGVGPVYKNSKMRAPGAKGGPWRQSEVL